VRYFDLKHNVSVVWVITSETNSIKILIKDKVSIPGRGWEFFSSPPCPERLWGHPASYPMGTRGSFPGGKAARA
jgi:hypothetical protein